jgi:aminomethyltransferase
MGGEGVTVIATDGPAGEEGYEVVCSADAAERVFETLLTFGMNAVPFGYETWETLTVEAGTPLFESELDGRIPNVLGVRNALDFEKGCYVGQEIVSKVENRGQPSQRLVGLRLDGAAGGEAADAAETDWLPDAGTAVTADGEEVGEVTRAVVSPSLSVPIALALVDFEVGGGSFAVDFGGESVDADLTALPFVEGSAVSARAPTYPAE